ncbi:MAG: flagellar basal-body rod protein FlgG [Acidobacteriaceae bacterium]
MIRALYTAASGMQAQQLNLDNTANNLANANTTGFRKRRLQFQDLMYQNLIAPGSAASQDTTNAGLQIGLGTRTAATEILQSQGDFQQTGNPLDLTIQGQGFCQIKRTNGDIAYTRAGSLHLDAQGNLVTAEGDALDPAITLPTNAQSISIGADGTVTAAVPGQSQPQQVGQIQLAIFANPGGLNSLGGNLFSATAASGQAITGNPGGAEGIGTLLEGSLENSNVNMVEEFVQMISAQRSYEANSRVVRAADDMLQQVNQMSR